MKILTALTLFCLLAIPVFAADNGWLTNLDDALKIAEKDNKVILMDFSGSDWCGWCIKLDKEVFSQAAFKDYAKDNLVLVLVDFPRKKELPAAEKAANDKLAGKYGIEGFPTVILVDGKGKLIAKTGYRNGGAAAYVDHIKQLLAKSKK
jgi:protein disulfide-isomerase